MVVAVELLIFMCVNKLLAGTGDPSGMIYPAGYGSGENSPPMAGMGILAVLNFYGGDGSEVAISDGDLPIAILNQCSFAHTPCIVVSNATTSGTPITATVEHQLKQAQVPKIQYTEK